MYLPDDTSEKQLYQDEVSSLVASLYQGVNSALLAYGEHGKGSSRAALTMLKLAQPLCRLYIRQHMYTVT